MNCKHCGAPLRLEEGQEFFHCQYCGSYDFPDANQDGVALLDDVSAFACPLCKEPLVFAAIRKIRILSCPNCRGNLIPQSKMLPILRQAKPSKPIRTHSANLQNKSELTRSSACPSCHKTMAAYPYGGPGNVIIQGCELCQLIWLDFGELSRIIRSYWELYDESPDELGARKKDILF